MTDVNILKYPLFANEKNELTDVRHLVYVLFKWDARGALWGNFLTLYTVSYIPPLSQSADCRKFNCSIYNM